MGVGDVISGRSTAEGPATQRKRRYQTGTNTHTPERSRYIDQYPAGFNLLPESQHHFPALSINSGSMSESLIYQYALTELYTLILIFNDRQ